MAYFAVPRLISWKTFDQIDGSVSAGCASQMPSNSDGLRACVKHFATRVLRFVRTLPRDPAATTVAHQLARAGSGVSANYHSAGRSRSRAEFIARLGVVVDEADESVLWLTKTKDSGIASGAELEWLLDESRQLRAIFGASLKTARRNRGDK